MTKIASVAVIGGTHGNEYTGIYLLQQWQQAVEQVQRDSFSTELVMANPAAFKENRRYLDSDLNRQFLAALLDDVALADYEQSRAKVLNGQLGPKGKARTDFIIDLHNTTSNMGPSLILLQSDSFNLRLAAYIKQVMPEAVIVLEDQIPLAEHPYLCSIAPQGVIVEIGPQPQSVLRHDVLLWMETMTQCILDYVDLHNRNALPALPEEIELYRYTESIKLPEDENGQRLGMVHKQVEDSDFVPVQPGDPIMVTFAGEDMLWQGDYPAYPHFINEAAYYNSNFAMAMAQKVTLSIPNTAD